MDISYLVMYVLNAQMSVFHVCHNRIVVSAKMGITC